MTEDKGVLCPASDLRDFAARCLERAGLPSDEAMIVADSLVEADLRGVDSHGVARLLGIYVQRLGLFNVPTRIVVERESAATVLLDGGNGPGAVVARKAVVIDMATSVVAAGYIY